MPTTMPASMRRALHASLVALLLVVAAGLYAPSASASTSAGVLSDDLRPQVAVDPDRNSVELGMRFTTETAGAITALQYYQGSGALDVTTARLWSSDGKLVADRLFRASRTEGWRTVTLRKPVEVKAGQTFVVSYLAPRGGYPATSKHFTGTTSINGLKVSAGAGVYKYGRGFPAQSYQNTNYLVDVAFTPDSTTAPAPPPAPEPEPTPDPTPQPTPSTGDLRGWQLNASNVGLTAHGLSCNTLPRYTGSLTPRAGARISGVRIEGILDLSAGDIVITKSCIRPPSGDNRNLVFNDNWRTGGNAVTSPGTVTITDSEFDGSLAPASQIARSCAFRGVGTLERNYMHGMGTGICFFGTGNKHNAIASKTAALRAGDALAGDGPRIYLDADVVLTGRAARDLVRALENGVLAGRPGHVFDITGASWVVRRWYGVRQELPSIAGTLWGAGCYALSVAGRARFEDFPDIVSDDLFIDSMFARDEITIVDTDPVVVTTPRRTADLLKILLRSYRTQGEVKASSAGLSTGQKGQLADLVQLVRRQPWRALDAVVYLGVIGYARLRARGAASATWERDLSSRSSRG